MGFFVRFYTFLKRENSTARPTGTPSRFSCVLKSESSQASPVIDLVRDTNVRPSWNYAFIEEFQRYYWINDWTWIDHRIWRATLTTDLLGTFRNQIGLSSLYVLRSSAASDGDIVDDYYPCKVTCQTQELVGISPWISELNTDELDLSRGVFVVGYVTSQQPNDSSMYGSVVYSAMRQAGLRSLVDGLLGNLQLLDPDFNTADASLALQKSLIDPLSYIKSCIWMPVLYDGLPGTELDALHIWDWTIDCAHKIIRNDPPYMAYVRNFDLTKHPQTLTRGNYLNTSPYTRVNLDFPPFGNIELDTTLTANATQVNTNITFDMITGQAKLRVLIDGVCSDIRDAMVGVPIQLSQVTKDYLGAGQSLLNGAVGIAAGALTGGVGAIAGAITGGVSGIANAVRSMQPRNSSISGNGSFSHLRYRPRLYHQFMIPVDEDNDHCGRPLCQVRKINTLPGYLLIKDAEVEIPGFAGEAEAVRAYLESGFFYE